jgi:hypothetical protein
MREIHVSVTGFATFTGLPLLQSCAYAFYPIFTVFEALEWAWNVLRTEDSENKAEATTWIRDMLFKLGSGTQVDFKQDLA